MEGVKGMGKFEFGREDIVRNPMLIEITDRYEKYKSENGIE
jgi:phosphate starvation-inducible protein PhoH